MHFRKYVISIIFICHLYFLYEELYWRLYIGYHIEIFTEILWVMQENEAQKNLSKVILLVNDTPEIWN